MRVQPVSIAAYRKNATPPPAPAKSAPAGQKRDVVQFSAAAAALLQTQQAGEISPRVAAIKQAVQSGAYQVDPQTLAVKLLPHL